MKILLGLTFLLLVLIACSAAPSSTSTPRPTSTTAATVTFALPSTPTITTSPPPTSTITATASASPSPTPTVIPTRAPGQACILQPIIVPTRPPLTPHTNQLDETTGMHITGSVQELDLVSYRLKVTGKVDHPLNLTLDELRCLPKVTATPLLACDSLFRDTATWSGVPIQEVLNLAGLQAGAKTLTMNGADGYSANIPLDEALKRQNFLAYEWQGQPVPILHGFPLRAVIPDYGGWAWVKWLVGIEVK